jgi:hypothetical protein
MRNSLMQYIIARIMLFAFQGAGTMSGAGRSIPQLENRAEDLVEFGPRAGSSA